MAYQRDAAFMLHQASSAHTICLLLTLTLYSPKSHKLNFLRSQAEPLVHELIAVWPRDTSSPSAVSSCCAKPMSTRATRRTIQGDAGRTGMARRAGRAAPADRQAGLRKAARASLTFVSPRSRHQQRHAPAPRPDQPIAIAIFAAQSARHIDKRAIDQCTIIVGQLDEAGLGNQTAGSISWRVRSRRFIAQSRTSCRAPAHWKPGAESRCPSKAAFAMPSALGVRRISRERTPPRACAAPPSCARLLPPPPAAARRPVARSVARRHRSR